MIRIYPIRTTKNQWSIFFYSKHECTTNCEYMIISDISSPELVIEKNPEYNNGICSKNLKIEKSQIRLSTFDKDNPKTNSGFLLNSDEEVISDHSFTISLYYPFSYIFDIFIWIATYAFFSHKINNFYKLEIYLNLLLFFNFFDI